MRIFMKQPLRLLSGQMRYSVTPLKSVIGPNEDVSLLKNQTIGFIGGGKITRCLIQSLINSKHPRENIIVSNPTPEKLNNLEKDFGIKTTMDNQLSARSADIVIMAVKPQKLKEAADEIKPVLSKNHLIISVIPGIRAADLAAWLDSTLIVRCMTNTAVSIGHGANALYTSSGTPLRFKRFAELLFNATGKSVWIAEESGLDILTPLVSCSAAYIYLIIEAIEKSAIKMGIDPAIARTMSMQTFLGAALMAEISKHHVSKLREDITTPNGITENSIKSLTDADIFSIFDSVFQRAEKRCQELSCNQSAPKISSSL